MDDIDRLADRAEQLLEIGRADEALDLLLSDTRTTGDAAALISLSICYHDLERYSEALKAAEASVGMDPDQSRAWLLVALSKQSLELPVEAVPPARKAVELAPWSIGAHVTLSRILAELGRFSQAYDHASQVRKLDPDGTSGWVTLCRVQLAEHQWRQAEESARKALGLDPEDDEAKMLLSVAQANRPGPDGRARAMTTLVETLRSNPDQEAARQLLIEVALQNKPHASWLPIISLSFLLLALGAFFLSFVTMCASFTVLLIGMNQARRTVPVEIRSLIWADRTSRYKIIGATTAMSLLWLASLGASVATLLGVTVLP